MANKNAKELINGIPTCMSGCFQNGVDATGCNETDYDCYCYTNNHQTIVDTMEVCLINRARRLGENCTDDEKFQMENRYWMVCEQYWEPTGTASEPASATMTGTTTTTKYVTSTAPVFTLSSTSATKASTVKPESAESSGPVPTTQLKEQDTGLSVGAQAGIGIGVALALVLVAVAIFLWFRERKKRQGLESKLAEAHKDMEGMVYLNEKGQVYEMEGDRPHCQELRGDMRTPELNGSPTSSNGEIASPRSVSTRHSSGSWPTPPPQDIGLAITADRTRGALSAELDSGRSSNRASSEEALSSPRPSSLRPPPLAPSHPRGRGSASR